METIPRIAYRAGYKYQLAAPAAFETGIDCPVPIKTPYLRMTKAGRLRIRSGYAWDGPSGPALDSPAMMPASLVHDALYQLIREEQLPARRRADADALFRSVYEAAVAARRPDGRVYGFVYDVATKIRAAYTFRAVAVFAASAASPANRKRVITAP